MEHDKVTTLELSCSARCFPRLCPFSRLLLLLLLLVAFEMSHHGIAIAIPAPAVPTTASGSVSLRFRFSWCNKFCGLMGRAFVDVSSNGNGSGNGSGSDGGITLKFHFDIRASINENVSKCCAQFSCPAIVAHFLGLLVFYRPRFLF